MSNEQHTSHDQFAGAGKLIVPQGYKLVPVEPTPEMLAATKTGPVNYPGFCWKAMLAAAPQPLAQPAKCEHFSTTSDGNPQNERCNGCGELINRQPAQPEQEPIAYMYHDAQTPKDAHPWLHSTMLVLAADRRPGLCGETPLYTAKQPQRQPLTDEQFATEWHRRTGRIMGTDKRLLLQAKYVTEAAHGIGAKP